jgi:phosphoribosylanthranilate isomerase
MDNKLEIKVCGMRDSDNIRAVAQLDIDLMGFIFYPKSPRFVQKMPSLAGIIPASIVRVGVFVNEMPQAIAERVSSYGLNYVQLHGGESRSMIESLRHTLAPKIGIIKVLNIATADDLKKCAEYEDVVDCFLFDTKSEVLGGSGRQFDWSLLDAYKGSVPFLLSGGIGPDDVQSIRAFSHPRCMGIDVNSRFETEPGVKDVDKLKTFVEAIRQ